MQDFVYDTVKGELTANFKKLLRPIQRSFPSCLAETWLHHLSNLDSGKSDILINYKDKTRKEKGDLFHDILQSTTAHIIALKKRYGGFDHLCFLIGAITVERYSMQLGGLPWIRELQDAIPRAKKFNLQDPIELLMDTTIDYFITIGRSSNHRSQVHALAFYYVARALHSYSLFMNRLEGRANSTPPRPDLVKLSNYFKYLGISLNGTRTSNLPTLPRKNRFSAYLLDRYKNSGVLSEEGTYQIETARSAISFFNRKTSITEAKPQHKTVVLGESGSGKTTFIRELIFASESAYNVGHAYSFTQFAGSQNYNNGRYWDPNLSYPPFTAEEIVSLQGFFNSFGGKVSLQVHDHKGDLLMDELPSDSGLQVEDMNTLEQYCHSCDHLIITIPPELIEDENRLNRVLNRIYYYVRFAVMFNSNVIISIVYTKCDDYGCLIEGPRRVISNRSVAEAFYRYRFSRQNNREDYWAAITKNIFKKDTPWNATKRMLLTKTAVLWKRIIHQNGLNHVSINGYFVSAHPAYHEDTHSEASSKGVLEVLSDFIQMMNPPRSPELRINVDAPSRKALISWTPDGPNVREYRIYQSSERSDLLGLSTSDYRRDQIRQNEHPITKIRPIHKHVIRRDPDSYFPIHFSCKIEVSELPVNQEMYYQVLVFDEFDNFAFSNIESIHINNP